MSFTYTVKSNNYQEDETVRMEDYGKTIDKEVEKKLFGWWRKRTT